MVLHLFAIAALHICLREHPFAIRLKLGLHEGWQGDHGEHDGVLHVAHLDTVAIHLEGWVVTNPAQLPCICICICIGIGIGIGVCNRPMCHTQLGM